jgi:hypothetical protein
LENATTARAVLGVYVGARTSDAARASSVATTTAATKPQPAAMATKVQKIMTQPINLIFRFLQNVRDAAAERAVDFVPLPLLLLRCRVL